MEPTLLQILFLGIVQGAAELLPVSSSAHVIVAEKLLGLDPAAPSMTFLLVMLHTGTMVAVILYFWNAWKRTFFADRSMVINTIATQLIIIFCMIFSLLAAVLALVAWLVWKPHFKKFLGWLNKMVVNVNVATIATIFIGMLLKVLIEKVMLHGSSHDEIEDLFGHLPLVGSALMAAGILIISAGYLRGKNGHKELSLPSSLWIGASQGLCLPFRGLSRSGTTISTGMLLGLSRQRVEEFSFALAVVITPPAIAKELLRLLKSHAPDAAPAHLGHVLAPGLIGMLGAFVAGLLALKLLSRWLEKGHWAWFGWYCIAFAGFVFFLASRGL